MCTTVYCVPCCVRALRSLRVITAVNKRACRLQSAGGGDGARRQLYNKLLNAHARDLVVPTPAAPRWTRPLSDGSFRSWAPGTLRVVSLRGLVEFDRPPARTPFGRLGGRRRRRSTRRTGPDGRSGRRAHRPDPARRATTRGARDPRPAA